MTSTETTRYHVYLATGLNQKIHFEMGWQAGQGQCDRSITVARRIAELDPDGGLDATIAAIVEHGISPRMLCRKCFAARTRRTLEAQYPARVAALGRLARYAVVDAHQHVIPCAVDSDEVPAGTYRLQVRRVLGSTAYLVPLGQVDAATEGTWWSTDAITLVPATELTARPEQ